MTQHTSRSHFTSFKKSKCEPQKLTLYSAHRCNELCWRVLRQEIKLKSRQIQLAIKLFQGTFFGKVSTYKKLRNKVVPYGTVTPNLLNLYMLNSYFGAWLLVLQYPMYNCTGSHLPLICQTYSECWGQPWQPADFSSAHCPWLRSTPTKRINFIPIPWATPPAFGLGIVHRYMPSSYYLYTEFYHYFFDTCLGDTECQS